MYVLDTNVVSELRKVATGRADGNVTAWVQSSSPAQWFVSVVTIHELELGVLLAERADAAKGAVLRRWLDDSVSVVFGDRILGIDADVARRAATLHVPDPAPFRDALIGATALINRMRVVTRNVADFARFPGLDIIDPWS